MTSGEANLVMRWIAQELARVGPTQPTRLPGLHLAVWRLDRL